MDILHGSGRPDAIVIMNGEEPLPDVAFLYVTGTRAGLSEGCLGVITPDGRSTIMSSTPRRRPARGGKQAEVLTYRTAQDRKDLATGLMKGFRKIGVERAGHRAP